MQLKWDENKYNLKKTPTLSMTLMEQSQSLIRHFYMGYSRKPSKELKQCNHLQWHLMNKRHLSGEIWTEKNLRKLQSLGKRLGRRWLGGQLLLLLIAARELSPIKGAGPTKLWQSGCGALLLGSETGRWVWGWMEQVRDSWLPSSCTTSCAARSWGEGSRPPAASPPRQPLHG